MKNTPDYKKIYNDMISHKYPTKSLLCRRILEKEELNMLDVIKLNSIITKDFKISSHKINQTLKSYDQVSIFKILDYQKKKKISNTELGKHFSISRNTIAKWKKLYF